MLKSMNSSLSKYHEPLTLLPMSLCELRTCSASKTAYCMLRLEGTRLEETALHAPFTVGFFANSFMLFQAERQNCV